MHASRSAHHGSLSSVLGYGIALVIGLFNLLIQAITPSIFVKVTASLIHFPSCAIELLWLDGSRSFNQKGIVAMSSVPSVAFNGLNLGLSTHGCVVVGAAEGSWLSETMSSTEYHENRAIFGSNALKAMLISPACFQDQFLTGKSSSPAMDFGTLVHALVLQPHLLSDEIAVYPGLADARSSDFKEFQRSRPEKLVVDEPTFYRARVLAEKVMHRRYKGRLIGDFIAESKTEVSIFFTEPQTGIQLKIRPDIYHPEINFDLKSTRFGNVHEFVRDARVKHYDLQAFMYTLGIALYEGNERPKPFVFVACENTGPGAIHCVDAGSTFMENGCKKFTSVMGDLFACMTANLFPDSGADITAEIEPYAVFQPNDDWKAMLAVA